MNLQDQVCTLQQSKRLKQLGVDQTLGYAGWLLNTCHDETEFRVRPIKYPGGICEGFHEPGGCVTGFAAFSVAELGAMLPHPSNLSQLGCFVHPSEYDQDATGKPWYVLIEYDSDKEGGGFIRKMFEAETEAACRAEALIHLLDVGTITVAEVNQRLAA